MVNVSYTGVKSLNNFYQFDLKTLKTAYGLQMKTVFFAARKLHHNYFSLLADQVPDSEALFYKKLLIPAFVSTPLTELNTIVDFLIQEKRNGPEGRQKSSRYWKRFKSIKRLEARWLYRVYYKALQKSKAGRVVVWNGLKYRQMLIITAAQSLGIRTVFMENGLLSGYTTLDGKGINYLNSVPREPAYFRDYSTLNNAVSVTDDAVSRQRPELLPDHYLFIPFQVNTDSQIIRFSPWIRDMFDLVEKVIPATAAHKDEGPVLIFKLHPACPQDYCNLIDTNSSDRIRFITDNALSTETLIQYAEAVITINSTVGIEALQLNKKVIVLGDAFYNIDGLTLSASDPLELRTRIEQLNSWSPEPDLLKGFFNYLSEQYQVPGRWQEADIKHVTAVTKRIEAI